MSDVMGMENTYVQEPYLYKLSSLYKEDYVPGFEPEPTSASELPEITKFAENFAKSVLEIWAGKRPASHLSKYCHRSVYQDLVTAIGYQKEVGKFRRIYINQPLDGLCESTVTVRFKDRLRSMALRFEGVDHKWICTSLDLI
ncbi:MAG: hypothetical protein FGM48_00495 [Candidatus Nanopelagicaceae bacterium]|nr:hypothetical protein [Candidatus Nanopelagicaceae bacterium]